MWYNPVRKERCDMEREKTRVSRLNEEPMKAKSFRIIIVQHKAYGRIV